MPIASDLQTLVSDVSADIAARKSWGRTELEKHRRTLAAIAKQLRAEESDVAVTRIAFEHLLEGVEKGAVNLAGLAGHARMVGNMPATPAALEAGK